MQIFKKPLAILTALSLSAAILFSGCGSESSSNVSSSSSSSSSAVETTVESTTQPKSGKTEEASPLLWKVEGKSGNVMYLFGTIHAGDERSDQVIEQLKDEINACDAVAAEFDVVAYESDYSQQLSVITSMLLKDGTTVKEHMRSDLYEKCVKYLSDENMYSELNNLYNMGFWYSLLETAAVQKSPLSSDKGMDRMVLNEAKSGGKDILELESAQSQTDIFNNASDDLMNLLTETFFKTADSYSDSLTELYETWLSGNETKLEKNMTGETEADNDEQLTPDQEKLVEEFNKAMYGDRNKGMAEKAEEYLESGKNVFFTAGTAHFLGDDGIIKLLTDKGYKVEKISIDQ